MTKLVQKDAALTHAKREGKRCARDGTSPSTAKWAASVAFKKAIEREAFMLGYRMECEKP
jgi:hypothetical protein